MPLTLAEEKEEVNLILEIHIQCTSIEKEATPQWAYKENQTAVCVESNQQHELIQQMIQSLLSVPERSQLAETHQHRN